MQRTCIFLFATALTVSVGTAQFQASNATARRVGLDVTEIYASPLITPTTITVDGPPNAAFSLFLDIGPADISFGVPLNGVVLPFAVNLGTAVSVPGTLGAFGTSTFTLGATTLPPGVAVTWQVAALDPVSPAGMAVSNGVRRITTNIPPVTIPSSPQLTAHVTQLDAIDVEQGDVDGDGDVDTILLGCGGGIWLIERSADEFATSAVSLGSVPAGSALELADLDNDGWLDMAVSSDFLIGGRLMFNQGRAGGPGQFGQWLGYGPATNIPLDPSIADSPFALDIETADIDGDGDLDFALACGRDPATGLENRLFMNLGNRVFTEVTRTNLNLTPFRDDTEDLEFFDVDGDDDYDLVFANYEGPQPGVDFIYVNNGAGVFTRQTITAQPLADHSIDVVLRDLNNDGFADIYVCNWLDPASGMPTPDTLYLSTGALTWIDRSDLLPDAPTYAGPTPLPAFGSADAEYLDLLETPSIHFFVVGAGSRCGGSSSTDLQGVRLLFTQNIGGALTPFEDWTNIAWGPQMAPLQQVQINDIETGDFSGVTHDRDVGFATAQSITPSIITGHAFTSR